MPQHNQSRPAKMLAPDADAILAIARDAMDGLPTRFRDHLDTIVLRVEEFADDGVLDDLDLEDAFELTGLYSGQPVGRKSIDDSGALPDMIHLYRVPILLEWIEGGEDLIDLVRHVLIHEVGHHFGLSDADIDAIEEQAVRGGAPRSSRV